MADAGRRNASKADGCADVLEASAQAQPRPEDKTPYDVLFHAITEAVAVCRPLRDKQGTLCDLVFETANDAFKRLFDMADPVGRRAGKLSPSFDQRLPELLKMCALAADTGTLQQREYHYPLLRKWLVVKLWYPARDRALATFEDVTERKQTETALQRLRYSLDRIEDYPAWSDSEGRIVEVSESGCRQLEYTREELLNMTVFDICPDIDMDRWKKSWGNGESAAPFRLEVHHKAKSGRVYPVELTVNPIAFDGQEYHCTFCRDISERRHLEESLRVTRLSVENAPDMIHWIDSTGRLTYANRATCDFLGYSLEELQTMHIWEISPGLAPERFEEQWGQTTAGGIVLADERWRTKDGREMVVEVSATNFVQDGKKLGLAFVRDVTERRVAEQTLRESEERLRALLKAQNETVRALKERDEQLRQSQKMEALGRLAGGIAHDFNNVLTTILGYSDLLLSSPECPQGSIAEDVGEIKAAAERASALTRRILAFSRRQALQPAVMSLNTIVSDTERLLARTIGADVELLTSLDSDLGQVEVDEQQFAQVLLNLAVNARDAMPEGGTLTLATTNVQLDEGFCKTHPEAHPGPYVALTVSDTGTGMDPDVLAHVFEPFYTTKPLGQGTGLGLATVYGIVTQSGGGVYVQSEPGCGTTFTIYLPQVEARPGAKKSDVTSPPTQADGETIMVVDSDTPFLSLAARVLEKRGYRVLSFSTGDAAVVALADPSLRVDVLLTDLTLSGTLQGKRLAETAVAQRPGLPVLFMSAQARDTMVATAQIGQQATYLEKPFATEELARKVRTCLKGA